MHAAVLRSSHRNAPLERSGDGHVRQVFDKNLVIFPCCSCAFPPSCGGGCPLLVVSQRGILTSAAGRLTQLAAARCCST